MVVVALLLLLLNQGGSDFEKQLMPIALEGNFGSSVYSLVYGMLNRQEAAL